MDGRVRDVCADCWQAIHPDDYAPIMDRIDRCADCGTFALVTRTRDRADDAPGTMQARINDSEYRGGNR